MNLRELFHKLICYSTVWSNITHIKKRVKIPAFKSVNSTHKLNERRKPPHLCFSSANRLLKEIFSSFSSSFKTTSSQDERDKLCSSTRSSRRSLSCSISCISTCRSVVNWSCSSVNVTSAIPGNVIVSYVTLDIHVYGLNYTLNSSSCINS